MWHYPPPLPVGVQYGTFPLEKTDWQFLTKLNIHLPCEPAIPLLEIYQEMGRHMFTQNIILRYWKLLFHWHRNLAAFQMPWAGGSLTRCGTSTAWNTTRLVKGQTTYCPGNRTNSKRFILSKRRRSAKMIYCMVPLHEVFLEKVKTRRFLKVQWSEGQLISFMRCLLFEYWWLLKGSSGGPWSDMGDPYSQFNGQSTIATVIRGKDNPHVPQRWTAGNIWLFAFWLCGAEGAA